MITTPDVSPNEIKLAKMSKLALSFPSLQKAQGVSPWEQNKRDAWASTPVSHGERCTAQFVLSIWGNTTMKNCLWKCGPFDFMDAFTVWDDDHRKAFQAWIRDPWWP
jgi:hypothetical protein